MLLYVFLPSCGYFMNSLAVNRVSLQQNRQADTGTSSGEDVGGLSSQSPEGTGTT